MANRPRYIVVQRWEEFQHYKDRDPKWIKNYLRLLRDDAYLDLTGHQRAVLHGIWLLYASSNAQLRADTRSLTRQLGLRVTSQHLESLSHAGFIRIFASRSGAEAAQKRSLETETEKKKSLTSKAVTALRPVGNGQRPEFPLTKVRTP